LILCPASLAFSDWLDGLDEIKIGDRTYPVCPEEYLTKLGFAVREVPDDQNAAIEYVKAINLYVKEPADLYAVYGYVQGSVWIPEANTLIPWLEKNAPAIAALREAAKKKDCKFPFLMKPEQPIFNMLLPHLSPMRQMARLLAIQGRYLEHQKKYHEALENYLVIARMGYHISGEPLLISGLVGIALDSISAKSIESCILRNRLDTDTLTYLLRRLDGLGRSAENYLPAMCTEKVAGLSMLDFLFNRPAEFYSLFGSDEGRGSKLRGLLGIVQLKPLGLRAIMKSDFRRYWEQMDEWNGLPDHIALRPENRLDEKIIEELPPWSLAKLLLPALSRARVSFVRMKATKAVLTAEVALEIYRNEKREYPRNLDQLKGILDKIPADPFTNEPLKYRRTERGYVVYSVNADFEDDGGQGRLTTQDKDIVGRYPLPEPKPFEPGGAK